MEKIAGKYFIENNTLKPADEFNLPLDDSGIVVYEVLRVISSVPLFLEEHMARLQNSLSQTGIKNKIDLRGIEENIQVLIDGNRAKEGNFKIVIWFKGEDAASLLYFIPHKYPLSEDYLDGVEVGILGAERQNPEAKTVQAKLRESANRKIEQEGLYEVLLVDKEGNIREGSRSNVFFISGNKIVTPPAETVLNGITRQKVVGILKSGDFDFEECPVALSNLQFFDCLFLTGTSPKVLPIRKIGNLDFDPQNQTCQAISLEYERLIKQYLSGRK